MGQINILIRKPEKNDANKIYDLVKKSKVLDVNSEYLYLLQTTHFKDTCAVAVHENKVIGFVSGYMLPDNKDTLFIWQVAIDDEYRGNDLARRVILNIIKRDEIGVNNIYSTVSPSNKASIRVFEKVANELNTQIINSNFFEISDFNNEHEEEVLYKIGPLK